MNRRSYKRCTPIGWIVRQNIDAILVARGMTQADLYRGAGIPQWTYYRQFTEKQSPWLSVLLSVAQFLKVPVWQLLVRRSVPRGLKKPAWPLPMSDGSLVQVTAAVRENIRILLSQRGETEPDLYNSIGYARSKYSRIWKTKRGLTLDFIFDCAQALGCEPWELLVYREDLHDGTGESDS